MSRAVARVATFLGAKAEECGRRVRDVLAVFGSLEARRRGLGWAPIATESAVRARRLRTLPSFDGGCAQEYISQKAALLFSERVVLKELGFALYTAVAHPHALVVDLCTALGLHRGALESAWAYANDAALTDVGARYGAGDVAAAAVTLALRRHKIAAPDGWQAAAGASEEAVAEVAAELGRLYRSRTSAARAAWLPSLRATAAAAQADPSPLPQPLPVPPPPQPSGAVLLAAPAAAAAALVPPAAGAAAAAGAPAAGAVDDGRSQGRGRGASPRARRSRGSRSGSRESRGRRGRGRGRSRSRSGSRGRERGRGRGRSRSSSRRRSRSRSGSSRRRRRERSRSRSRRRRGRSSPRHDHRRSHSGSRG